MRIEVSDGIHLNDLSPNDTPALVEYLNDREIYDQTLRIPYPYSVEDAERFFAILAETKATTGENLNWAIRDANSKLLGGIGLERAVAGQTHRADLGYWLAKPFRGQGIMTKVVGAVCRHAFDQVGLSKISAHVFPFNTASVRVLKNCGFQQEGFLKQHHCKDGRLIDGKLFGRLRTTAPADPLLTGERIKQVIVMRHDLGMRRGKQIAQGAHAAMSFLSERLSHLEAIQLDDFSAAQQKWLRGSFAKVCCRVNSEAELMQIYQQAEQAGLEVHLITDSGRTEFHGEPTRTCLTIGPDVAEQIDAITGHLELL